MPDIKGLREYGVTAHDVIRGKVKVGNKAIVIGGGLVGVETADHLAEHGCTDVTIIEMMPQIVRDGEPASTYYLIKRINEYGVKVLTSAAVQEISANSVIYKKDGVISELIDIDTVIIAIGVRACTVLEGELADCGATVISVGDCHDHAKNGYMGIREGFEAGSRI